MNPGPASRPNSPNDLAWGLAAVALIAGILVVAGVYVVVYRPEICAGCPGQTPLGTTLTVATGTGGCASGNGTSSSHCDYVFAISVDHASDGPTSLTAQDLAFQIQNGGGAAVSGAFRVTLVSASGCGVGTWNSTTSTWGSSTEPGPCANSDGGSASIVTHESFVLTPTSEGGRPISTPGNQLVAMATGGGFSGSVMAEIP